MKIKITVTDEMIRRLMRSFNPALDYSQAMNAARMVLNIVERDLNDAEPEVNPERLGGCVMIETEECE